MSGLLKFILITAVGVALIGIVLHEVSPQYITSLMGYPSVRAATMAVHNFVRSFGNPPSDTNTATSKHKTAKKNKSAFKERLFTAEELKNYDGKEGNKGPYLAILGRVYNVKKGKKHYGPGGGYEFFAGRDGSRAFVSGEFTKDGLTDDISDLSSADYIGLDEWIKFYETDYKYVGKLIGRYYDEFGAPTSYNNDAQRWISEAYFRKESDNQEKRMFPPCNSEWSPEAGARVWCTLRSGGVEREWTGVPRKFYNPGKGKPRCACVKNLGPPSHDPSREPHDNRGDLDHPNIEEYEGCQPDEITCFVKDK